MLVGDLSTGERLLIARRRNGESQAQAAERLGVRVGVYGLMERDQLDGAPRPALGRLSTEERCLLVRRRRGLTLRDVAERMGMCVFSVRKMEHGETDSSRLASELGV